MKAIYIIIFSFLFLISSLKLVSSQYECLYNSDCCTVLWPECSVQCYYGFCYSCTGTGCYNCCPTTTTSTTTSTTSTTTSTTTTSTTTTTIPTCTYTSCNGYISYSSTGCKCGTATCYYGYCCASRNACFTTSQSDCQSYCAGTTTTTTSTTSTTTTTLPTNCYYWGSPETAACRFRMKDSGGNYIDWYDFKQPYLESCCGIKSSQDSHYKPTLDSFGNPTGTWCPTTETMWKAINSNSWPSGFSDGETCKVWYWCGVSLCWREGKWDPDDNACLITSGAGNIGACNFTSKRETTASGVKDLCGSSTAGDGKCEQACGADSSCDEKDTGDTCGTNGRCASYCLCCEASDSDGGKVYTIKGTTSGPVLSGGVVSCNTTTDYCVDSKTVREYYIDYLRYLVYQDYDCSQRTDGLTHCVDGKCGCLSDNDCKDANGKYRYDPVSHTKIVCDSPSGSYEPKENTYTCRALRSCSKPEDCEDTWCCDTITGAKDCKSRGTILNVGGKSYLCDPPEGFDLANKQLTLLDFLLKFNPFSKVFS